MDPSAFIGLIAKEVPVVALAFVVHLTSNADAVVINAVCGDDLYAGSVGLGEDVFNGMRACVTHGYSPL